MNDNDKIKEYENKLDKLNDDLDDLIENFKYMLIHHDIKDINILNFHYEIHDKLNKIDYIESILFNLKY